MGKSMACVRSFGSVGIYNLCAAFVILMGTPLEPGDPALKGLRKGEKTPIKNKGENNMSKKLLSLALALVMCLGLTVPAFVAGTVKVVEDKTHSVKITMNGFL